MAETVRSRAIPGYVYVYEDGTYIGGVRRMTLARGADPEYTAVACISGKPVAHLGVHPTEAAAVSRLSAFARDRATR